MVAFIKITLIATNKKSSQNNLKTASSK